MIVVDKPAGLVVHPGAGNPDQTLQNALLAHDPKLAKLPRAGIVHRLDKDTSGLLIVARNEAARTKLADELAAREIHREYQAVCVGVMTSGGKVDAPIDRHPVDRVRMAVRTGGRESVTHYRVIERYRRHTWVRVTLETGRTHQIRLHLSHAGYPLVGDAVYGGRLVLPKGASPAFVETLRGFRRQALHAAKLAFPHPQDGRTIEVESPLPADFRALIAALKRDRTRRRADGRAGIPAAELAGACGRARGHDDARRRRERGTVCQFQPREPRRRRGRRRCREPAAASRRTQPSGGTGLARAGARHPRRRRAGSFRRSLPMRP